MKKLLLLLVVLAPWSAFASQPASVGAVEECPLAGERIQGQVKSKRLASIKQSDDNSSGEEATAINE